MGFVRVSASAGSGVCNVFSPARGTHAHVLRAVGTRSGQNSPAVLVFHHLISSLSYQTDIVVLVCNKT